MKAAKKIETMGVTEFKVGCLALIDRIQRRQEPLLITKKGKPAVLVSAAAGDADPLAIYKFGGGKIVGDILSPVNAPDDWEYD